MSAATSAITRAAWWPPWTIASRRSTTSPPRSRTATPRPVGWRENAARLGADPDRLAIGGDSAGGNIACGVTLKARDRGGPAIAFQLLIYPATDLAGETESKRLYSSGYLLDSMPFYVAS